MSAVQFLFDYASPYSFLANELLARELPGAAITYVPVYLRGLEMFAKGLPYTTSKLAYLMADLRRCAAEKHIAFAAPAVFPINGLYALRGAIAAQRAGCFDAYHTPMFRAVWQHARDVGSKDAVVAFASELGLGAVASALDDVSIKDALRAATDEASRRGVFGVPAFFVGGELFWGHDRMHQVALAAGLS
jgi:2-hydroxychromene-2-carboxylate isomerase